MGYDIDRFPNKVDEEFKCQICWGVLEDPSQIIDCEHTFCRTCIIEWFKNSQTCPVDRIQLVSTHFKPIPRILRNIINQLKIHCKFKSEGCNEIINLEDLESHHLKCEFNPEILISCSKNCGTLVPKNKLDEHDCMLELRNLIYNQQKQILNLNESLDKLFVSFEEQREMYTSSMNKVAELTEKCDCLKSLVDNLESPIQKILNNVNNNLSLINNENLINKLVQETTVEIYISSLDRKITCETLIQYLETIQVNVIVCKPSLIKTCSRDFRVTVLKSAAEKVLVPKVWPIGVMCFICGEFYSTKIEGNQSFIKELNF